MPEDTKPHDVSAQDDARPCVVPVPTAPGDLISDNASPGGVQKKRSKSCRPSLLADRQFLIEYKALSGIREGVAPVQGGVSPIVARVGRSYASTEPPSFMTKIPRHWRDATDETKAHFALEALLSRGPVIAFTAWTSQEISDRAYASGKPLVWLRKRVVEALGAAFGQVELFASIEEAPTDRAGERKLRLHLHGALNLHNPSRRRLARVRQLLRRATGPWDEKALKAQVKLRLDVDRGWAGYCTKHSWLALPGIRQRFARAGAQPGTQWRLSFEGPVLTMTNNTRARAKNLHRQAREAVLDARQLAMAAEAPQN